jgi:cysteine desulfurase
MTYLDANATEPLRPEARSAVLAAMDLPGNPSSVHAAGRMARGLLEEARRGVAARFGAPVAGVVFTSGGTEADALAINGLGVGRRLVISAVEHDAVRAAAPGAAVAPVDADGVVDLDALAPLLAEGPALLCLMLANNETGTIQPVAEAAALCRRHGALLHVDAVQAAGRIAVDMAALGADSMALSGHKLGGPKGAGALLLAPGREVAALIAGGGQEKGRRGGTPALPAIAGFAAACGVMAADMMPLRTAVEQVAVSQGAIVLGGADRLPNTVCIALPGVPAETQVIALDLAGVQVSAGAACSSGKVARSHVLAAMGLGALAGDAIRVSLPWNADMADVQAFAEAYAAMVERLRRRAA